MPDPKIIISVERGKVNVLATGLDRFGLMELMGHLTRASQEIAPKVPKNWSSDPAWARTSSKDPKAKANRVT